MTLFRELFSLNAISKTTTTTTTTTQLMIEMLNHFSKHALNNRQFSLHSVLIYSTCALYLPDWQQLFRWHLCALGFSWGFLLLPTKKTHKSLSHATGNKKIGQMHLNVIFFNFLDKLSNEKHIASSVSLQNLWETTQKSLCSIVL